MAEQMMQDAAGKAIPAGYKQTEVGVIPEDWGVSSLKDVAFFGGGTTPSRSQYDLFYKDGHHPWVKTLDLNNGPIFETDEYVTDAALTNTSLRKHKAGSVLVAMYGGFNQIGRTGLLRTDAAINQALLAIIPDGSKLYSGFLLSQLNYHVDYWKLVASSSRKDPNITSTDIKNYELPLPSVKEQTAIANVLSDSDALIDALEQLIAKKQAIKSATMQQLLTGRTRLPAFALRPDGTPKGYKPSELGEIPEDWEVTYLLDVATLIHGKAHEPYVTEAGKYIVINSKFVSTGGEVRKYCSQNDCAARNGDVLMVLSDLPNGKALAKCFYADQNNVYAVNQRVCIFRTNIIVPKYLYLVLNRHKYFLALDDGVTQTHILNGDIANCQLYAPVNKAEQTAIATILSDMDNELQALTQKLDKARALKQGMMQQLLTGKIRLPLTAGA
ncbi:restriction endonuclease subunit S [Aeromonas sp. QDB17]|uniref:restriction endonuclease subunit S n=1 Tax=Aeromonas sp. QDB17 TaxID=2990485 RepID=UPI0022DF6AFE|nr:restriction endonuclease subunit S [Aeromonas sp. QDB17]